jgi:hypothetical protein
MTTKRPNKLADAKKRGRKAFRDGVPFSENPEHGLGDWQDWRAGWCEEQAKAKKAKKS